MAAVKSKAEKRLLAAHRQQLYRERRQNAGLVAVQVWVKASQRAAIHLAAKKLRERHHPH